MNCPEIRFQNEHEGKKEKEEGEKVGKGGDGGKEKEKSRGRSGGRKEVGQGSREEGVGGKDFLKQRKQAFQKMTQQFNKGSHFSHLYFYPLVRISRKLFWKSE